MGFSKDFIWGAASASYQTEGGYNEDGKGLSIWDEFTHQPGNVYNNQNGDTAADAYHRFEEDLDLMQEFGIRNYRFSISWPRVLPEGTGKINYAGLDYYDRMIDGCLERGIVPWITLYHWDLPLALYEKGGWLERGTAEAFGEYSRVIAEHFAGRVTNFITINEPQIAIGLGMITGIHAPGLKLNPEQSFRAWHNILLAHGISAQAVRSAVPGCNIGIASTGWLPYIHEHTGKTPTDLADAAFLTSGSLENSQYFFNHHWFLDPVCKDCYPEDPHHPWYELSRNIPAEELDLIHQVPDFTGLNIYNGSRMKLETDGSCRFTDDYPGYPRTSLKWPVTPEVFYWGPRLIYERYGLPVYITEGGQACNDRIYLDGKVHDADRIDFLHRYLIELRDASDDDVPVKGFFHWSLTDNLEWHSGYDDRFGLIYIDYRDLRRIPKDSAYWYQTVIADNGSSL